MNPILTINFEKHRGSLFVECNKVQFYGTLFKNINSAVVVLKHVKCDEKLVPFFYKKFRGFVIESGEVVVDTYEGQARWFCDTDTAKVYLNNKPVCIHYR